uniref:Zona pellucida sperm-binding protein 3 n=1 Tax=Astyanax mexicanus TaxID=7994 RepID=A0A8B9JEZ9_ASTMX
MAVIIIVIITAGTVIWARAAPDPVRVLCTERAMVVSLSGRALRFGSVRFGTCGSVVERETETELVLQAELHECGSTLRVEGDSLVYENILFFVPDENPYGIVRSRGARVPVQCRYPRIHFVSTKDMKNPRGQLTISDQSSAPPRFSLQLMNDDWWSERSSSMYRQGEVINLKASVARTERTPAKLYVDTCVFTLQPDVGHTPRYPLIHNHGCSANPRSLLPTAHFLPRSEDHSLRLQMETRRFSRNEQITVYIRCVLKVTAEEESSVNKACSFTGERYRPTSLTSTPVPHHITSLSITSSHSPSHHLTLHHIISL